ncbi:MAG: hypothetical protein Q9178_001149, partial [Gyalolechia marmorata]
MTTDRHLQCLLRTIARRQRSSNKAIDSESSVSRNAGRGMRNWTGRGKPYPCQDDLSYAPRESAEEAAHAEGEVTELHQWLAAEDIAQLPIQWLAAGEGNKEAGAPPA